MGLFEFFSKITHPAKRNGWVETDKANVYLRIT